MPENRKFICIRCPQGCEIQTTLDGKNITSITGNTCKLGDEYVQNEINDPRRTLTSLVGVRNGIHPVCPVWTTKSIPKEKIPELMQILLRTTINAPIRMGDVIIRDFASTGADIAASRDIPLKG
jgi:CxxC motif-containing protein